MSREFSKRMASIIADVIVALIAGYCVHQTGGNETQVFFGVMFGYAISVLQDIRINSNKNNL